MTEEQYYNEVAKRCHCCAECGHDTVCAELLQGAGCARRCTCDADLDAQYRAEEAEENGEVCPMCGWYDCDGSCWREVSDG